MSFSKLVLTLGFWGFWGFFISLWTKIIWLCETTSFSLSFENRILSSPGLSCSNLLYFTIPQAKQLPGAQLCLLARACLCGNHYGTCGMRKLLQRRRQRLGGSWDPLLSIQPFLTVLIALWPQALGGGGLCYITWGRLGEGPSFTWIRGSLHSCWEKAFQCSCYRLTHTPVNSPSPMLSK